LALFRPIPYDRAIIVFSPEGRILQVEYATECAKRGSIVIGVTCEGGVILAAEQRLISKLQDPKILAKIFQVDEHVGAAIAGISADARILINQARVYAQSYRLLYDEPIDLEVLTKRTGDLMQLYTQHAGVRPFGVSLLFSGVDKTGSRLFQIDPGGNYFGFNASAIGARSDIARRILEEEYHRDMMLRDATMLAIKCLDQAIEGGIDASKVIMAIIPIDTKRFRLLTKEEIKRYIKEYLDQKKAKKV
jgi:proteasome alpha subunit